VHISPRRTADQDRDHELIITPAEIPDRIAALQRALDYEGPCQRGQRRPGE
jgi:hypothetical protein